MRECIIASLLAIVGLFSIGVGVHQLHGHGSNRQAFEQHVADVCVQAARRTLANKP
jgi:hypothetical protein